MGEDELRQFVLSTGALIPSVGLGTWPGYSNEEQGRSGSTIKAAIQAGYRHIDCASNYRNQKDVGNALQQMLKSGIVKREELWITSKLWNSDHDNVQQAFEQTLSDLQLEYLDLYLIHWPIRSVKRADQNEEEYLPLQLEKTWREMEKLFESTRARAIGVCNFSAKRLERLLSYAKVPPAVNQVECHPVWQQKSLREYCASKGIHLSGYSPLGNWGPAVLGLPSVIKLSKKLGKTPAQIALRWGVQSGHSVLPKSSNPERMKENLGIFGWCIPDDDFKRFEEIEQKRLVTGEHWVTRPTTVYKSVEELWDE